MARVLPLSPVRRHLLVKDVKVFLRDVSQWSQLLLLVALMLVYLYNFRVLLDFCDKIGVRLAEEFYWHNPAKLPSPIEWVNKRKIRVKDSVNTVWWFSKTDWPKADVKNVLAPYSDRMKKLISDPEKYYRAKGRPSGHDISMGFGTDNGGAIPPNLQQIPNTESISHYLQVCKHLGVESHPARFPADLPSFFIRFLTDPGDVVMDIFSGSNTTGAVAEMLGRRWLSIDVRRDYAALSAVRFMEGSLLEHVRSAVKRMERGQRVEIGKVGRPGVRPAGAPAARAGSRATGRWPRR